MFSRRFVSIKGREQGIQNALVRARGSERMFHDASSHPGAPGPVIHVSDDLTGAMAHLTCSEAIRNCFSKLITRVQVLINDMKELKDGIQDITKALPGR